MSSTRDALYRAICARPDEDTPRLAFADLVEEEGDAIRAGFIRSQIVLEQFPAHDPHSIATRQHQPGAASGHHVAHTLPRLPEGFSWRRFAFRRGFPWLAGIESCAAWRNERAAVFERAPIQALSIDRPLHRDMAGFANWSALAHVRRLEFSLARLGDAEVSRLCNSPHNANLTELAFRFDGITAQGLETLVQSQLFAQLVELDLESCGIDPSQLADALASAPESDRLARLSLAANRLSHGGAERLLAAPAIGRLRQLDLGGNPRLGVAGMKALAKRGIARNLEILQLGETNPGTTGLRELASADWFARVRILNLSGNRLSAGAIRQFAGSSAASGLRVLDLSRNPIGNAGVAAIADSPALGGLLELDLRSTGMTSSGALAIARSPHLKNLLRLSLDFEETGPGTGSVRVELLERFGPHLNL